LSSSDSHYTQHPRPGMGGLLWSHWQLLSNDWGVMSQSFSTVACEQRYTAELQVVLRVSYSALKGKSVLEPTWTWPGAVIPTCEVLPYIRGTQEGLSFRLFLINTSSSHYLLTEINESDALHWM
jgi:hypothetical protein